MIFLFLTLFSINVFSEIDIEPPSPPWWEIFTLHGIDSDNDGVRDDVEIWINENYKDVNMNLALKNLANSYKRLNDSLDDKDRYRKEKARYNLRNYCWDFVSLNLLSVNPAAVVYKLHDKVLNTPLRSYYFKKGFSNLLAGSYTMPSVDLYLYGIACEFSITNPRKIMDEYLSKNPGYKWEEKQQNEFKEIYETKSRIIDPYVLFHMERRGF